MTQLDSSGDLSKGLLFRLADTSFEAFDSLHQGKVVKRNCGSLPFIHWPNGGWCIEANLFMNKLDDEGKSRRSRGGTLATWAIYISHLLKFVALERTTLALLSDEQFGRFLKWVSEEHTIRHGALIKARNGNTARSIGVVCLNFLNFLSDFYSEPNLLGETGRIRAFQKPIKHISENGKKITVMQWHHRSLSQGDVKNKRFPIDEHDLKSLKQVASEPTKPKDRERIQSKDEERHADFIRHRRQVTFSTLDVTGMRRMEASLLTVGDVLSLIRQMHDGHDAVEGNSELVKLLGPYGFKFRTVKHKRHTHRIVPVNAIFIQTLEAYLDARKRFLRRYFPNRTSFPSDAFFISTETGEMLQPNSFTNEMSILAKRAGIESRATSPHLIRHLFIARLFVRLLMAHDVESQDEFRRLLVSSDKFKQMVKELSGHSSTASLEPYLNIAINQITNIRKTLSRVQYQSYVDSLKNLRDQVMADIRNGANPSEALRKLSDAITTMEIPLMDVEALESLANSSPNG